MGKTAYMVLDGAIANNLGNGGWVFDYGNVFIGSDAEDAKGRNERRAGSVLYRCEPISADEEPAPVPRTVKAYVAFDPDHVGLQPIYAASTPDSLRVSSACRGDIFEIALREVVPPPEKRETGWAVKNPSTGSLYGRDGYGLGTPFVFSSYGSAEEMAKTLVTGVAVEVYRDTLEPVDAE